MHGKTPDFSDPFNTPAALAKRRETLERRARILAGDPQPVPHGLEQRERVPDYVNGVPRQRQPWELPPVMSVPSYPPQAPPPKQPPPYLPASARGRPKFPPLHADPEPATDTAPAPLTPDADKA